MVDRFYDDAKGGFFEAPKDATDLFVRRKDLTDGSEPSASGRALAVLSRFEALGLTLGHATALTETLEIAELWFSRSPTAVPTLLDTWDRRQRNGLTAVVVSKSAQDQAADALWGVVSAPFAPHATLARVRRSTHRSLGAYPLLEDKYRDEATGFVCIHGSCDSPTSDPEELARQFQKALVQVQ
jgi:uncharacterized protein YyaL (SSP411 family)